METSITVNGLRKRYRVGGSQGYQTLRESIVSRFHRARSGGQERRDSAEDPNYFWALDNVSFEVARGEILGIIGSNGAGKSTVLKILSRITRPTAGRVELYGRVRSLLEVGTGFHPELSGRENIFLNGAILGMRRSEISRKFDEIVAFAEVEKFIDTPVKRYSSGMYVRLAFAVAAHLEPEILLVDEVLAVGDTRFYQKSTDKMRELNERGMTIVLVSHHMWLIQTVCTRGILLERGRVAAEGKPQVIIDHYRRGVQEGTAKDTNGSASDAQVDLRLAELTPFGNWASEREATPESGIRLNVVADIPSHPCVRAFVRATSPDGFVYFTLYSQRFEVPASRRLSCEGVVPRLMLNDGDYDIWVGICSDRETEEVLAETHFPLVVKDGHSFGGSRGAFWNHATWKMV